MKVRSLTDRAREDGRLDGLGEGLREGTARGAALAVGLLREAALQQPEARALLERLAIRIERYAAVAEQMTKPAVGGG